MTLFEPFCMYRYEHLGSRNRHRIWGEFARFPGINENSQLTSLSITLERLREVFSSTVLIIDGEPPAPPPDAPRLVVRSRIQVTDHNGELFAGASPSPLLIVDIHRPGAIDFVRLADDSLHPGALLFGHSEMNLQEIGRLFESANALENLRPKIFALAVAYLGFDHEAFFTFETTDTELTREALRVAEIWEPRHRQPG